MAIIAARVLSLPGPNFLDTLYPLALARYLTPEQLLARSDLGDHDGRADHVARAFLAVGSLRHGAYDRANSQSRQ
jgi:hypothetical protein